MKQIIVISLLIVSFSCTSPNANDNKIVIDFADTLEIENNINNARQKVVYIAIASMTSPKETYIYYSDLIKYISKKVGYPIYIKQKKTYEEVNKLLENSEVDFAFICSGAFIEGYKENKIKLLVAPQIKNKITYKAYIITQKNSTTNDFRDFDGKSFAFTDPLSNTGRLFPLRKVIKLFRNENDFFEETVFTYGHDISIQMVNRGIIDGASVHGLIFDYLKIHYPQRVNNIKIIEKSEKFGMPPIVMPRSLSNKSYETYQKIFLNIHNDSIGKKILNKLNIDKFVTIEDSLYNSIFELKEFINDAKTK